MSSNHPCPNNEWHVALQTQAVRLPAGSQRFIISASLPAKKASEESLLAYLFPLQGRETKFLNTVAELVERASMYFTQSSFYLHNL